LLPPPPQLLPAPTNICNCKSILSRIY